MSQCHWCGKDLTNTSPRDSYRVRREDSKFCDDNCRTDYHNARRKYERKLKMIIKLKSELWELKQALRNDPEPLPEIDTDPNNLQPFFQALIAVSPIDQHK